MAAGVERDVAACGLAVHVGKTHPHARVTVKIDRLARMSLLCSHFVLQSDAHGVSKVYPLAPAQAAEPTVHRGRIRGVPFSIAQTR